MSPAIVIVGASRGLGHALAAEFLRRGWDVVGTVRPGSTLTVLHELIEAHPGRLSIETLDVNDTAQLGSLRARLTGRSFDALFINAGTTIAEHTPIGDVATDDFVDVMVTNALSPLRVIETLKDLVTPRGLIGAMSSGQGSIANNTVGGREVYRGSKAALNMLMRSLAAREADTARSFVLLAPGWVRTRLGGDGASYSIEETAPALVDILLAKRDRPGLEYLDRFGHVVPW